MTIAFITGGALLRVGYEWWPTLDELVEQHGITEVWHGGYTGADGELAGADAGIEIWAKSCGIPVTAWPAPIDVYAKAGLDERRAVLRLFADVLDGQRGYVISGEKGREASVVTTETSLGRPGLVVTLPGGTLLSSLSSLAQAHRIPVVKVSMWHDPGLPRVVNGHHYRDIRADEQGRMPGHVEGHRIDTRPPLPDPWLYIGRACNGHKESPLHNPFAKGKHGGAALDLFRRHLWGRIRAKDKAVLRALDDVTAEHRLVCWCLNPDGYGLCHGQIVVKAWDWIRNEGG